ncbi:peptide chain release factor 1 [Ramaria rubella]|nr:peptide chain release factor 1 [Ramaria rubella]
MLSYSWLRATAMRGSTSSCRSFSTKSRTTDAPSTAGGDAIQQLELNARQRIRNLRLIKELEPLQTAWDKYAFAKQSLHEIAPLLSDPDPTMRSLARTEHAQLLSVLTSHLSNTFPALLIPASSTHQHSALMELKAGVGGDEAALFVSDLLRMYGRVGEAKGWKVEVISREDSEGGKGTKNAVAEVRGEGAYDMLRWESGVHRVQRVPETEKSGRVHTSTAAVVVLPLSHDTPAAGTSEQLYDPKDVKIEVMRARGAGGQHVNKTESAVRLTHTPSGITVSMQDERSQHRNRDKAFRVLSARLLDRKLQQDATERRSVRQALVRGADRNEKVRTYNWAQGRVTDHRINMTINNLDSILEGEGLEVIVDALKRDHDAAVMEDLLDA